MKRVHSVLLSFLLACSTTFLPFSQPAFPFAPYRSLAEIQGENPPAVNQENPPAPNQAPSNTLEISAPSALLMEASTGQVIYEKNADEPRSPASITKIMTLILIFDALESGKINMDDSVTTSAYAKSMGGSQVFLEEGEVQTVETLIKCIVDRKSVV